MIYHTPILTVYRLLSRVIGSVIVTLSTAEVTISLRVFYDPPNQHIDSMNTLYGTLYKLRQLPFLAVTLLMTIQTL